MTVKELIARLERMPQNLEVRVWDADADDYAIVTGAIWEDGTSCVDLTTGAEPPTVLACDGKDGAS